MGGCMVVVVGGLSSDQSNYGSNQRFCVKVRLSHLHHNTVCNINFRVYCLLEVQSMKSH